MRSRQSIRVQTGTPTEESRARKLLNDILPCKGRGSFDKFRDVLLNTVGQEHIVTEIIGLKKAVEGTRDGDQSKTTPTREESARQQLRGVVTQGFTVCQSCAQTVPSASPETSQLETVIVPEFHSEARSHDTFVLLPQRQETSAAGSHIQILPSALDSRKRRRGPPSPHRGRGISFTKSYWKRHSATFFLKPEHRVLIQRQTEGMIKSMCHDWFGLEKEAVQLASVSKEDLQKQLEEWDLHCYVDLDAILAVLLIYGVEPEQIEQGRRNLEHFLELHLQNVGTEVGLPKGLCKVLEILVGSSFVVLQFSVSLFLALLCTLGDRHRSIEFTKMLQGVLAGASRAVLRLGCLPPLELYHLQQENVVAIGGDQGYVQCASGSVSLKYMTIVYLVLDIKSRRYYVNITTVWRK